MEILYRKKIRYRDLGIYMINEIEIKGINMERKKAEARDLPLV